MSTSTQRYYLDDTATGSYKTLRTTLTGVQDVANPPNALNGFTAYLCRADPVGTDYSFTRISSGELITTSSTLSFDLVQIFFTITDGLIPGGSAIALEIVNNDTNASIYFVSQEFTNDITITDASGGIVALASDIDGSIAIYWGPSYTAGANNDPSYIDIVYTAGAVYSPSATESIDVPVSSEYTANVIRSPSATVGIDTPISSASTWNVLRSASASAGIDVPVSSAYSANVRRTASSSAGIDIAIASEYLRILFPSANLGVDVLVSSSYSANKLYSPSAAVGIDVPVSSIYGGNSIYIADVAIGIDVPVSAEYTRFLFPTASVGIDVPVSAEYTAGVLHSGSAGMALDIQVSVIGYVPAKIRWNVWPSTHVVRKQDGRKPWTDNMFS